MHFQRLAAADKIALASGPKPSQDIGKYLNIKCSPASSRKTGHQYPISACTIPVRERLISGIPTTCDPSHLFKTRKHLQHTHHQPKPHQLKRRITDRDQDQTKLHPNSKLLHVRILHSRLPQNLNQRKRLQQLLLPRQQQQSLRSKSKARSSHFVASYVC